MNIREFCQDLQNIYDEMSERFSKFQKDSGLYCLEGCGKCCSNPDVEATVLEMFPLALRILDENKLEYWLDKLEDSTQGHCTMYESHSADGSKGLCGIYQQRPSVCRMFGVAGYYNKHHEVTLSVCRLIRDKYPDLTKTRESETSAETPMLVTWSYKLAQLDPELIHNHMPINQAIKQALERISLYALYQSQS